MLENKKGVVGAVMTLIFAVILIIGVGIPITQQVISTSNLTGLTATVVAFIPVFLALGVLALGARFVMGAE